MNKSKIGLFSATFIGVSAILGSGWLFAPYKTAMIAGPASIYAWLIGAFLVFLLAFCYAEIAAIYPKRGLAAIIPALSHNKFFGFPFALANWLGVVAVIGLEADATVQYMINLFPSMKSTFFLQSELTWAGVSLSAVLVLLFCLLNYWGAKLLAKTNNILTVIKLIIPVVTALIILSVVFHPHNFTAVRHSFMPYGLKSIFVALITSGIVVAFNGFQTVVTFASEVKDPHKVIPRALVLAIIICLVVYLLLQVAFIGGLPTAELNNGWRAVRMSAPMVELSVMLGIGFIVSIIYFGATIAPSGAAVADAGSATRMFTAMSRREQMPRYFDSVHPKYRVSRRSLCVTAVVSLIFIVMFRSWSSLAQVLSLLHIVSYLPIPIALVVFRNRLSANRIKFKLFGGKCISLFVFAIFTYLLTLIEARLVFELVIFLVFSLLVFILLNVRSWAGVFAAIQKCYTVVLYFLGLLALSEVAPGRLIFFNQTEYATLIIAFSVLAFYILTRPDKNRKLPHHLLSHSPSGQFKRAAQLHESVKV